MARVHPSTQCSSRKFLPLILTVLAACSAGARHEAPASEQVPDTLPELQPEPDAAPFVEDASAPVAPAEVALGACARDAAALQEVEGALALLGSDERQAFARRCARLGDRMQCRDRALLVGTLVHLVRDSGTGIWDLQLAHVRQWSSAQSIVNSTTGLRASLLRNMDAARARWLVHISAGHPRLRFDDALVKEIAGATDADLTNFSVTLSKIRAGSRADTFELSAHPILADAMRGELQGGESLTRAAWDVLYPARQGLEGRPDYAALEQFIVALRRYPSAIVRSAVAREAWKVHPHPSGWRSRLAVMQSLDPRLFRFARAWDMDQVTCAFLALPASHHDSVLTLLENLIPETEHYHSIEYFLQTLGRQEAFADEWLSAATANALRLWPTDAHYTERLTYYPELLRRERDLLHEEMLALVAAVEVYDEPGRLSHLRAVRYLFGEPTRGIDAELATWMVRMSAELSKEKRDALNVQMHKDAQMLRAVMPNDPARWVEAIWHLKMYEGLNPMVKRWIGFGDYAAIAMDGAPAERLQYATRKLPTMPVDLQAYHPELYRLAYLSTEPPQDRIFATMAYIRAQPRQLPAHCHACQLTDGLWAAAARLWPYWQVVFDPKASLNARLAALDSLSLKDVDALTVGLASQPALASTTQTEAAMAFLFNRQLTQGELRQLMCRVHPDKLQSYWRREGMGQADLDEVRLRLDKVTALMNQLRSAFDP